MAQVIILDSYRTRIDFAVKQRATLLNVLAFENRDATPAEEARLDELERRIAYGTPRNVSEARAQLALVQEIYELLNDGLYSLELADRAAAADMAAHTILPAA